MLRSIALTGLALLLAACSSTPKYQGMDAGQLWSLGQQEFGSGDFSDAAETLERLMSTAPTFERRAEAQLLLARAYFADEQFVTAQAEYIFFLDRYPQHPSASEAALGVCRSNEALSPISQRDQTFTRQALEVCANVASDYAGTPEAEQAAAIATEMRDKLAKKTFENAEYYFRREFWDPAIIYYDMLLEEWPGTPYAPRALGRLIEVYQELEYDAELEETRQRLLAEYPESKEARALDNGGDGGSPARDAGL